MKRAWQSSWKTFFSSVYKTVITAAIAKRVVFINFTGSLDIYNLGANCFCRWRHILQFKSLMSLSPASEQNDARYLNEIDMVVRPAAAYKHISETFAADIIKENRKKNGLSPQKIVMPKPVKVKHRRL